MLYPLLTQWGGANEPIAAALSFMPLEMGNGIILWLFISGILNLIIFFCWKKQSSISLREFGVFSNSGGVKTQSIVFRSWALAMVGIGILYLLSAFIHQYFKVELRFLWPLIKPLTQERWDIFLIYWLPIVFSFLVINGLIISVQMKQALKPTFTSTLISWSVKTCIFAVAGLLILWLFHFGLAYWGIGPGFDVIGLPKFGGRWMMMLAVIIPQLIVFTIINHWCYLKTGYIYLGVFLTSLLMTWVMVGGQVMGRFLA